MKKRISKNKKDVLEYLEKMPPFRERRLKNRGIGNLVTMSHPCLKDVPKEVMAGIVEEILAYDRYWRKILQDERTDLRGRDYFKHKKTKEQLEQEKMISLGYKIGYRQLIKS